MKLKQGQYINNGEKELLVCDLKEYKNKTYVYLLDEETDDVAFYELEIINGDYEFTEVIENSLIQELILSFAEQNLKKD